MKENGLNLNIFFAGGGVGEGFRPREAGFAGAWQKSKEAAHVRQPLAFNLELKK